ncbi:PepSY domain-containing protein [Synechococcus moorigangaii CMS01]|nr:PepSY domain-containing protein [Synechococcus moorigangaii CMS01]
MPLPQRDLRQLHRRLVPIMVAPLLVTVLTGSLFQVAALTGKSADFYWLLAVHRGRFGPVNLENIYPFLNAFGLLLLLVSGAMIWWTTRPRKRQGT